VVDFEGWTGIKANILEFEFDMDSEIPRILGTWAFYCVEAAQMDPKYCLFASTSMNTSNPVSDLMERIDSIIRNLTQQSFVNQTSNRTYTLFNMVGRVRTGLMRLPFFWLLGDYLLTAEDTILSTREGMSRSQMLYPRQSDQNMTFAAITSNASDPLEGDNNPFAYVANSCLDGGFEGIDTFDTWLEQFHRQVNTNPLVGCGGLFSAACLTWPNLTDYGVERYEGPVPEKLRNKMLIIGVTNDPVPPFSQLSC
jgi:hypothetical protein